MSELEDRTKAELADMAVERGIEVVRRDGEGDPLKSDYVAALERDDLPLDEEHGLPVNEWHGHPNYHCPERCGYAHLDPAEVFDHWRRGHR